MPPSTLNSEKASSHSEAENLSPKVMRESEGLSVDLAVDLEGLEGLEDGLVVVSAASHLAGEQGHHLGEVHGSGGLVQ